MYAHPVTAELASCYYAGNDQLASQCRQLAWTAVCMIGKRASPKNRLVCSVCAAWLLEEDLAQSCVCECAGILLGSVDTATTVPRSMREPEHLQGLVSPEHNCNVPGRQRQASASPLSTMESGVALEYNDGSVHDSATMPIKEASSSRMLETPVKKTRPSMPTCCDNEKRASHHGTGTEEKRGLGNNGDAQVLDRF
jgi:hypothetical protein